MDLFVTAAVAISITVAAAMSSWHIYATDVVISITIAAAMISLHICRCRYGCRVDYIKYFYSATGRFKININFKNVL